MISQEAFNEIIDLLGDVAKARLAHKTLPFNDTSIDRSQFQTDVDSALLDYNQAVTALYQTGTIPEVYSSAYHPKMDCGSSSYYGSQVTIQTTRTIDIAPVITQLNQDFVLCDNTDDELYIPLSYTGRHQGADRTQIELTASYEQTPEPGFFPILIPSFWMDVLSHLLTLVVSICLIATGAGLVASGGLGAIFGVCALAVGIPLYAGFMGAQLGFFSHSPETPPPATERNSPENQEAHQI